MTDKDSETPMDGPTVITAALPVQKPLSVDWGQLAKLVTAPPGHYAICAPSVSDPAMVTAICRSLDCSYSVYAASPDQEVAEDLALQLKKHHVITSDWQHVLWTPATESGYRDGASLLLVEGTDAAAILTRFLPGTRPGGVVIAVIAPTNQDALTALAARARFMVVMEATARRRGSPPCDPPRGSASAKVCERGNLPSRHASAPVVVVVAVLSERLAVTSARSRAPTHGHSPCGTPTPIPRTPLPLVAAAVAALSPAALAGFDRWTACPVDLVAALSRPSLHNPRHEATVMAPAQRITAGHLGAALAVSQQDTYQCGHTLIRPSFQRVFTAVGRRPNARGAGTIEVSRPELQIRTLDTATGLVTSIESAADLGEFFGEFGADLIKAIEARHTPRLPTNDPYSRELDARPRQGSRVGALVLVNNQTKSSVPPAEPASAGERQEIAPRSDLSGKPRARVYPQVYLDKCTNPDPQVPQLSESVSLLTAQQRTPVLLRDLYPAQARALATVVALVNEPDKSAFLLGETGVGKTSIAIAAIQSMEVHHALIVCPPHLTQQWVDEIALLTGEQATIITTVAGLRTPTKFSVLSREVAKLGQGAKRYPLANIISKRYPRTFDMLVVDEAHEYSSTTSIQTRAIRKLYTLNIRTILLTGSLDNGFARSLFIPLWHLNSAFRADFTLSEEKRFVHLYGYPKRVVTGNRTVVTGQAPGIMPRALFRYLLPRAAVLPLADVMPDLPPVISTKQIIDPGERVRAVHEQAVAAVLVEAAAGGAVFGQVARLPYKLDTGLASSIGPCPLVGADTPTPSREHPRPRSNPLQRGDADSSCADFAKDDVLLTNLCHDMETGRASVVFAWHVVVLDRIEKLCQEAGLPVARLTAAKVPTGKRRAWITAQVAAGVKVLLCNPVTIQTGLNNLVAFNTIHWYENPSVNPQIVIQAQGRLIRPGQQSDVRILTYLYDVPAVRYLDEILDRKVTASKAINGLDPAAALASYALDGGSLLDQSTGRVLLEMLQRDRACRPDELDTRKPELDALAG